MYKFGKRSIGNFDGIHSSLVGVCYRALSLSPHDFGITEGVRSVERQRQMVVGGKSQTMHSYPLTGKAVDFAVFVDGKITWEFEYYVDVADAFKQAATEYGIEITWGGDWVTLRDGPHIQIEGV